MNHPGHIYTTDFYDYISAGSRASAEAIVPLVREQVRMDSILDVGAGNGSWLSVWMSNGIDDAMAIDGAYVDTERLAVPPANFTAHDLTQPLDLDRRFDLVQSLEVAEHIPETRADAFVDSLCRHGDIVLFSAAVRHQGGEFHVNEQPPEYWRWKFAAQGYDCFDWLRPRIAELKHIKPWYRFNIAIYANPIGQERLSADVASTRISESERLGGRGDIAWQLRRMAVAFMPRSSVDGIATLKSKIEARANAKRP